MTNHFEEDWLVHANNNFHMELSAPLDEEYSVYDVYQGKNLVAKVRGKSAENRIIIPLRELSDEDEDQLYQFVDGEM